MNWIDKVVMAVDPVRGLARINARHVANLYEATQKTQYRKNKRTTGSGDREAGFAVQDLREQARYLEQNYDVAKGALDVLETNIVGTGIVIEPQVTDLAGELLVDLNDDLFGLYEEWTENPEVSKEHSWADSQRLAARSLFRDGEIFCSHIVGDAPKYRHDTVVPYSIELLESDFVPWDYHDDKMNIKHGIARNDWFAPVRYYVYKNHPSDANLFSKASFDMKEVSAKRMTHVKLTSRVRQSRGISAFSTVMIRLDGLKEFEDSERIAARIASAQVLAITRNGLPAASMFPQQSGEPRSFSVSPGAVWDGLQPGESVEVLSSNRPNNNIDAYRSTQLKSASSGLRVSNSSLSKNYDGTYSAQRQELVEQYGSYAILRQFFVNRFMKPVWRNFIDSAVLSGAIKVPRGLDPKTLYKAEYRGAPMPWIDPAKEIEAEVQQIEHLLKSKSEVMRERNRDPRSVRKQIKQDADEEKKLGIAKSAPKAAKDEGAAQKEGEDVEKNDQEKEE